MDRLGIHGVGIDVVDVSRVARLLTSAGERFAQRWFTPAEIVECEVHPKPHSAFAERLAAKEAVWKALRVSDWSGAVPWRQIGIVRESPSSPAKVELTGDLAKIAAGIGPIHLHWLVVEAVAVAVAVVESAGGIEVVSPR